MSSTTDPHRSSGQALALFALALVAILGASALAFDGGLMYLERRDQQNAADAAAIGGAHYLTERSSAARTAAESAAYSLAAENGFDPDADSSVSVRAESPPWSGPNRGQNGFIEVQISSNRPSLFAGILGFLDWDVSARAVAINDDSTGGGWSILALNPTQCGAIQVGGSGSMIAYGNIQVNSDCTGPPHAMNIGGQNSSIEVDITVPDGACDAVGSIEDNPQIICTKHQYPDVTAIPDPLFILPCIGDDTPSEYCPLDSSGNPVPRLAWPDVADPPQFEGGTGESAIPDECPGSGHAKEATMTDAALCSFGPAYADSVFRLFPGTYPGGLAFKEGTYYLEPGIYAMGGGGLTINAGPQDGASLISVVEGGGTGFCSTILSDPSDSCGVMIYNGELPDAGSKGASGPIHLNGGSADVLLHPLDDKPFVGVMIYQDRSLDETLTLNGNDSVMEVRGTVYVPGGEVKVNGSSPADITSQLITDQIIADTYLVGGATGSEILALNNEDVTYKLRGAGLVE